MTENNESENRRIDINEGNYNERIEGNNVQGKNNFFNSTLNFILFGWQSSSETLTSEKYSCNRQNLLKLVDLEVKTRISSSLHNQVYISLDVEQNPEQIELPWASEIKVNNQRKVKLDNTNIINIFDQEEVDKRLLILGQPGSGKTTMLLKLAEELVKRANNDPTYPVPVLFSLSSWKNDNQSIKDWLIEELKDTHGQPKDIGKLWINNQGIIPLLDGLDELATKRQEKCVLKINEFLHPSNWNNPVIVCSRIQEYERYTSLLHLNSALELYPFSQAQVYQYLQSTDNLQLWNSISHDSDLSQLAKIPLLLNIIILCAEEISIQTWQQSKSFEERLSYLFDTYIRRMFKRRYKGKDKQPKLEDAKHWLGWLAQQLIDKSSTEFYIERIQPDWLKDTPQKIIYFCILSGVTGGLIFGIIYGKVDGGIHGSIYGSIYGLFYGLFYSKMGNNIYVGKKIGLAVDIISGICAAISYVICQHFLKGENKIFEIDFQYVWYSISWLFGADIITVEILNFSLINFLYLIGYMVFSVVLSRGIKLVIPSLILGLVSGIRNSKRVENKTIPNQGIRKSFTNTILIFVMTFLFITLVILINLKIRDTNIKLEQALICSLVEGLFFGLLVAILGSGIPVIKHFVLRIFLWSNDYTPWDYAKFLNYCTERLFLQRVGGSYRFMHDQLRQHFAKSYGQSQKRS